MLRDETSGDSRGAIKFSKTHGSSNFTIELLFDTVSILGITLYDFLFLFFFNFRLSSVSLYEKNEKNIIKRKRGIMYVESYNRELKYSKVYFKRYSA